jgi:hypothetical protein
MHSLHAVGAVVSGRHIAIQTKLTALEPVYSYGFVVLYFHVLCHWHKIYRVSALLPASSPELLNNFDEIYCWKIDKNNLSSELKFGFVGRVKFTRIYE